MSAQASAEPSDDTADCRAATQESPTAEAAESEHGAVQAAAVNIRTAVPDAALQIANITTPVPDSSHFADISTPVPDSSHFADIATPIPDSAHVFGSESRDELDVQDACSHVASDLELKVEESAGGQETADMLQYVDQHGGEGEEEAQKHQAALGPHVATRVDVGDFESESKGDSNVEKGALESDRQEATDLVPAVGKMSDAEVAANGSHDAGLECLQRLATLEDTDPCVQSPPV